MKKLWVYGTGGHATVIADLIISLREYQIVGFIDDDPQKSGSYFYKHANVYTEQGFEENNKELNVGNMFIAIGDCAVRKRIAEKYSVFHFPTFIHPTAILGRFSSIREGSAIMPYAIVESEATIGKHCIINNASIIGHGVKLGDYCHVGGGAVVSGGAQIGNGCLIGVGATVTPLVKIGKDCTVGAGAVIAKNISDGLFMFGNPARHLGNFLNK